MKRLMLVLAVVFLLMGVVSADRSLVNVVNFSMPANVIAGSSFDAEFSFDYMFGGDNVEGSPLIIRLDIVSGEDGAYPVWKGDFEISGRLEKSWTWTSFPETIEFNCSEEYNQTIEHPLDAQNVSAPDGVFYCYNEEGDLRLNEKDEVILDIVSHHALYPGKYTFSASMFYLTDERAPVVNITNKDLFEDVWYRENDNVLVRATIEDVGGVAWKRSSAVINASNGSELWIVTYEDFRDDEYYFSRDTPVDINESDYELFVFAEDEYGNRGNDSVTLRIDTSGPNISLVSPSSHVSGMFWIEANVTDLKSGVDDDGVEYKLKEKGCEDGKNVPGCYNSGWLPLYSLGGDLYGVEVNATEVGLTSGSYNLQIRAVDILGNMGVLE